jgi:hypothetical protein
MSDVKSVLTIYSTILGGFYAKSKEFEVAMRRAHDKVGADVWKRGFSNRQADGATAAARTEIALAGIEPTRVNGNLVRVAYVENTDGSGNVYPKLRVGVENLDHEILLSLDIKDDVAQRLISKLDNCQPGQFVVVSAWPSEVERSGRVFVNHAVSVKDENKNEIPHNSVFSGEVKKLTDGVAAVLSSAGITDPKTISAAKIAKRIEAHKKQLAELSKRFVVVAA